MGSLADQQPNSNVGAFADLRFCFDGSVVVLNNLFGNGQSNTLTWLLGMKFFENAKNFLPRMRIKPNSLVTYGDSGVINVMILAGQSAKPIAGSTSPSILTWAGWPG